MCTGMLLRFVREVHVVVKVAVANNLIKNDNLPHNLPIHLLYAYDPILGNHMIQFLPTCPINANDTCSVNRFAQLWREHVLQQRARDVEVQARFERAGCAGHCTLGPPALPYAAKDRRVAACGGGQGRAAASHTGMLFIYRYIYIY